MAWVVALVIAFATSAQGKGESCSSGDDRQRQLCSSIERHLRWTWTGHAVVSPAHRATAETLRAVYCEQHLGPADLNALKALAHSSGTAVSVAAENLHALVAGYYPSGVRVEENSILWPGHPAYVLRNGCVGGGSAPRSPGGDSGDRQPP